jgi:2-keto-4-pentenoate hydratase/2-oxohepta-3-ene-1,7-dioic acid hydratase in catechol pathway
MKIFCIGRNYAAHAAELNNEIPDEPIIFMKPPKALLVNDKDFYIPMFSNDIHYEVEVVLKIIKNGKVVNPKFAKDYYEEVALGIDFTARDVQAELKSKGHPWEKAKAFDNSAVLSDFVSLSTLPDPILFSLTKNGEVVQSGNTSLMLFPFEELIVHISKYFTLQKGDYIYTGTPAGVGRVAIGDELKGYIGDKQMFTCKIK